MVKTLHREGIEVIVDVVYTHTGEGKLTSANVMFSRNRQPPAYYRLVADDRRYYMDYTGCGNTLEHERIRAHSSCHRTACATGCWRLHVDGFRFDLASTLARDSFGGSLRSVF